MDQYNEEEVYKEKVLTPFSWPEMRYIEILVEVSIFF